MSGGSGPGTPEGGAPPPRGARQDENGPGHPQGAELFPAEIRALGVGLGYALANSAFGGTAPLLYEGAKSGDNVGWFIVYVTVVIAVSLSVYVFALKNKGLTVLDREQGSAWAVPPSRTG